MFRSLLFLSAIAFLASFVTAQTPAACDIQIKVYPIDGIREETPVMLSGAKVILKNDKGKTIKPSADGEHFYPKLPQGDYEAVAAFPGYKTTIRKIGSACEETEMPIVASEYIFMWKGDSKEKMNMNSISKGVFAVARTTDDSAPVTDASSAPVINGNAKRLVSPAYPRAALAVRASGTVNVQVTIDELGYVIAANAVSGHPMLRFAAEKAARESKFTTTTLEGIPVKVTGIIVYNFAGK